MYPVLANGIRTGEPRGFNKGRSSMFREGSRVRQTSEEGRRIYRPKHCGNNNKHEDNSSETLNDKNHQASSLKFRQLILDWNEPGSNSNEEISLYYPGLEPHHRMLYGIIFTILHVGESYSCANKVINVL